MSIPPNPAPGRVLVADDDADIRELIIAQLEREPYLVTAAGSVAEIRTVLAAEPVDVVVLDLNLPDGDGLVLCKELRAEGFVSAIIMVTARDSTAHTRRSTTGGSGGARGACSCA